MTEPKLWCDFARTLRNYTPRCTTVLHYKSHLWSGNNMNIYLVRDVSRFKTKGSRCFLLPRKTPNGHLRVHFKPGCFGFYLSAAHASLGVLLRVYLGCLLATPRPRDLIKKIGSKEKKHVAERRDGGGRWGRYGACMRYNLIHCCCGCPGIHAALRGVSFGRCEADTYRGRRGDRT